MRSAECGVRNERRRCVTSAVSGVLLRPIPAASLAAFRILFGLLMAGAMVRVLAKGWVDIVFLAPAFHFSYPGFAWVKPLPAGAMHAFVAGLAVCALGVAAGFVYRVCAVLFFVGFAYLELIERANYLNHYWLVTLLAGLCAVLPLHREWSWDAARGRVARATCAPAWQLWMLRFQVGVVYVFAGLAKLNADWLFRAEPLRTWLAARADVPLLGPWLAEPWMAFAMSWAGAAYDLGIVAALLCARTRPLAYATVVVFHVVTALLFPIGLFPWLMIAATTLFFPPDWPRGGGSEFRVSSFELFPAPPKWAVATLAVYCVVQIALPVRPFFQQENSAWTGRGFNFSWRVMLVERSGHVEFFAFDPATQRRWRLPTHSVLTPWQERLMAQEPELVRQFAQHLADKLRRAGHAGVEVRAEAFLSLNGRPHQRLLRPDVNLAGSLPPNWILPAPR
ncbi:MAG: hypothetical protein RLZZ265_2923 [Verrucomicrobiota bacterium]|jgi:vitamin K-dependent gamma-carboxylase